MRESHQSSVECTADDSTSGRAGSCVRRLILTWLIYTVAWMPCVAWIPGAELYSQDRAPDSQSFREITPAAEAALHRGLEWLAREQGAEGSWGSDDLGLVSLGALAFLASGHTAGKGPYARVVELALDHVLKNAKPTGLLNTAHSERDMYNHGLSTFVLGQAFGMTNDSRIGPVLDRALRLIESTQCKDGGWVYSASREEKGHDLSLAVMQAKALRGAVDSGLDVSPSVIRLAIRSVHGYYVSAEGRRGRAAAVDIEIPGRFTYDGKGDSLAMAAAGVVCLQEFGRYDDWRIPKNLDVIRRDLLAEKDWKNRDGRLPCGEAYSLFYVAQAIYQVGGRDWRICYPILRDRLVATQMERPEKPSLDGAWADQKRVHGKPGRLFATAVACFVLAIPNRYLPILQEGRIERVADAFKDR